MTYRIVCLTWLTVALGLIAPPLAAERNLIPSLESIPDVCFERPNEPDWMENIALRDAYQRVLVQDIYRAQSMRRIVETGSCDCATRFPTWDSAEGTFRENHADGLSGSYGFARAAMGNQQAYNRYLVGGASGAEYAALRARQMFGVQQMPQRPGMANVTPTGGNPSTGTGSQMLAQLARLGRLGRR